MKTKTKKSQNTKTAPRTLLAADLGRITGGRLPETIERETIVVQNPKRY